MMLKVLLILGPLRSLKPSLKKIQLLQEKFYKKLKLHACS